MARMKVCKICGIQLIGYPAGADLCAEHFIPTAKDTREYTGGSVNYYKVRIDHPTSDSPSYVAECNDIIEALGMNYAEGNAFKAIWRACAARQGLSKKGYNDSYYDAEKVVFFGERMKIQARAKQYDELPRYPNTIKA